MNKTAFYLALALTVAAFGAPMLAGALWPASACFWLLIWPYLAAAGFLTAALRRFFIWAATPVAYNTPLAAGPIRGSLKLPSRPSLNPPSPAWVWARLAIEALTFRTLWLNLKYRGQGRFRPSGLLAAGALIFHWSLLIVLAGHLRFFWPVSPEPLAWLARFDGRWLPINLSTLGLALGWLIMAGRRLFSARLKMLSRFEDWLALGWLLNLLLSGLGLAAAGLDLIAVQRLLNGLMRFQPILPEGVNQPLFMAHFFQAGLLLIYLPARKLSHGLALFLNPTLAQANNGRAIRHFNPRQPQVPFRAYAEYEAGCRAELLAAGLPLEGPENHDQAKA